MDPTECKHAIRHLNGTDNPQLNAFQKQRLLETKQLFRNTILSNFHYSAFAWITLSNLFLNSTLEKSYMLIP